MQLYNTRNQLQEENWNDQKYLEIKQHATEQQLSHQGYQGRNTKYIEKCDIKLYGMQQR